MEAEQNGVDDLSIAEDFIALCRLGHPLDEAEGVLAEIGDVHRVDVQCRMCATVFVFRRESEHSAYTQWRLVESSDAMIGEYCATKRIRVGIAEERRRMRFQAH